MDVQPRSSPVTLRSVDDHTSTNFRPEPESEVSISSVTGALLSTPVPHTHGSSKGSPSPSQNIPYSSRESQETNTDEILAIQALGQLKSSGGPSTPIMDNNSIAAGTSQDVQVHTESSQIIANEENAKEKEEEEEDDDDDDDDDQESYYDTNSIESSDGDSLSSSSSNLLRKMKSHPLVNSAVRAYESNKPAIKKGVEIVERAALPMVTMIEETRSEWKRKRRLTKANEMFPDDMKFMTKKQRLPSISDALSSLGNKNLNEISLNMSIESKKRLTTCLQLLMLANKQISSKVNHLQEIIIKEQEIIAKRQKERTSEDQEVFHDALEDNLTDDAAQEIKREIVGTVKKVVSFISKYAGNSLPEPARSDVRETLLKLPKRWSTQTSDSNSFLRSSANGKVLVLANESLEMVGSVMSVFDETLAKAELWVKQKHEKQLAKQAILNSSLKRMKDEKDEK